MGQTWYAKPIMIPVCQEWAKSTLTDLVSTSNVFLALVVVDGKLKTQTSTTCLSLLEELKSVNHGRPGAEQTEAEGAEEEEETQEASERSVLQSLHTSGQLKINCELT